MRLLSATVRCYRVHQDLHVDFERAVTLVGGPNECGKSTFVEAIHRALFLKATVTGEAQESMISTLFPGKPEVEIRFEARGTEYGLMKRFSGHNGTARLAEAGGETWQGEEAEDQLASLLGVEEVGGGRGVLDRVKKQWAHLWVWQGESGRDFAESVEAQQAGLLRRLQQVGGAVAMQSELDDRVATLFSESRSQTFGKRTDGTALKNSDLGRAQAAEAEADQARTAAADRVDRMRQAVKDHERASAVIKRTTADLAKLTVQLREVDEKLDQVNRLRSAEESQARDLKTAEDTYENLQSITKRIAELRDDLAAVEKRLKPLEEQQKRLEDESADARTGLRKTQESYDRSSESTRGARLGAGLAEAYVRSFKVESRLNELTERMKRVQKLEGEREKLREQLVALPQIDQAGLDELRSLDSGCAQASAALKAMAAEVEVVAADAEVSVGEERLSAGQHQTVTDTADVRVGDTVHLRIHPGGGDALSRASDQLREQEKNLRQALDKHGLESISATTKVVAQRADLQLKLNKIEAALSEWDADNLAALTKGVEEERTAVLAEIERREQQVTLDKQPETISAAEQLLSGEQERLQSAESEEKTARGTLEALRKRLDSVENELSQSRDAIGLEMNKRTEIRTEVELLVRNHGDDDVRAQDLKDAEHTKGRLEDELAQTRAAVEALQPDLLEKDKERLEKSREERDAERQEAEKDQAVSESALRSDGAEDPNAALAQAKVRLEAARDHLGAVERKAKAIALVDDLFQQEQRALADQFSKPLADRIDAYLRCVFGSEAKVTVAFEENRFTGVRLARSGPTGATDFGALSEGTREQVAAAVRLAIAELLAADHDGTLPVFFDDAFANSDPERVGALQRMLDLAASRGLQVIVLTCNPSDYAGLGAREVLMEGPKDP